jgi:surface protein
MLSMSQTCLALFYAASSFNSDVSSWNVSSVTDLRSMFEKASSFNQNLCPWGPKLPANYNYVIISAKMFSNSSCANTDSPTGPTGPWCAVTNCPTASLSLPPTGSPTASPTASPSLLPTASPTAIPSVLPLKVPRQAQQQARVYLPQPSTASLIGKL